MRRAALVLAIAAALAGAVEAAQVRIPALAGARGIAEAASPGDEAVLDADEGHAILRPEQEVRRVYDHAQAARTARQAGWAALRDRPARTADGRKPIHGNRPKMSTGTKYQNGSARPCTVDVNRAQCSCPR